MRVKMIVESLQAIKAEFPNLTNEEVLKILEIKTLMEIKANDR